MSVYPLEIAFRSATFSAWKARLKDISILQPENIDESPLLLIAKTAAPTLIFDISACARVIAKKLHL
jgi:hypothetical protein